MKKIAVCGHFGGNSPKLDGQTIRTRTIMEGIVQTYGAHVVHKIDTCGMKNQLLLFFRLLYAVSQCSCLLILPAQNALKIEAPFLSLLTHICHCKIHYVASGGWLPDYLNKHRWTRRALYSFHGIYVQLESMRQRLMEMNYKRVYVLPNFRFFSDSLSLSEKNELFEQPYRFVIFSRVTKEKGIEDAVKTVIRLNTEKGEHYSTLDIYGEINPEQKDWFDALMNSSPNYITYKGCVPYQKSVDVLRNYHIMLFPTYYDGEGFAGSVLDAYAAGLPVVASDWKYNAEVVKDGETGFLFEPRNLDDFFEKICKLTSDPDLWNVIRINCLRESLKYKPEITMKVLLNQLCC